MQLLKIRIDGRSLKLQKCDSDRTTDFYTAMPYIFLLRNLRRFFLAHQRIVKSFPSFFIPLESQKKCSKSLPEGLATLEG